MSNQPAPSDEDLQAYVDGCLNERDRALVAEYLLANPEAAAKVRRMQRLDHQLRKLGQAELDEPVPDRLRRALRRSSRDGDS